MTRFLNNVGHEVDNCILGARASGTSNAKALASSPAFPVQDTINTPVTIRLFGPSNHVFASTRLSSRPDPNIPGFDCGDSSDDMATHYSPSSLNDVSGLVVVVTGGGTGIGAIMAKTLEANGAKKVYITGRREDRLQEVAKQAQHGNIVPLQASVTSHDDLQRIVDHITNDIGHIDLLVNNAGMTTWDASGQRPKPTVESSAAEVRDYYFNYRPAKVWTDCLETNVAAVFTTSMAFLELLDAGNKKRDKSLPTSQIISVGSVGGMNRATDSFVYNASKAAVHHLMKNLGATFIPFNIRTNVIAPGWFPSEMTAPISKAYEGTKGVMPKSMVPQERMGTSEEMAGTILYLAGKAGGYCNGSVMLIDGGFLANHAGP
ncbi:hypothetical protein AMS68_005139 [Peltaster fructicola]|uniref:Uncharacterized protein n=1 Tax=Peltaster fructicola TaxID=286661 RepID=A0A6H0XXX6_9PEZI|nr:hypothetical protein AMS68_005139 [Peltaster fructicola]